MQRPEAQRNAKRPCASRVPVSAKKTPLPPLRERGLRLGSGALVGGGLDDRGVENRGGFLRDPCALEEARVLRAPQPHRIGEDKVAEIVVGDEPLLDELMRLRQRVAEIDDVEMPDIGAEDRVELSAERVTLAKGGRVHAVVRLAAEIERVRVEIEPVLFPRNLARREIVELGAVAGQIL